jgi:hypothetical protein
MPKKYCFPKVAGIAFWLLMAAAGLRADVAATAVQGRFACMDYTVPSAADTVQSLSTLRTRSSTSTNYKSWVQFDLATIYAANPGLKGNVVQATLTLYGTASNPAGKIFTVNGLNDSASLENWDASALTWNNAPGNDISSQTALTAGLTAGLGTFDVAVGDGAPTSISSSALATFVNADTDEKITFILTPGFTTYFYNAGSAYPPRLTLSTEALPPKTLFVSTTGSDTTGDGAIGLPYGSIGKAVGLAGAGDIVYVRAGTYAYFGSSTAISLPVKSGAGASRRIYLMGYNGERPLVDFSAMTGVSADGLRITGSYWYVRGIDFKGAPQNGVKIYGGSYNTVEFCSSYQNRNTGVQLSGGAAYNRIVNCDSYRNYDPQNSGGDADGFSPKMDVGTGNYFYGCRSWDNSDDGYDGYLRGADDVSSTFEYCWASRNGWNWQDGSTTDAMNGNGFKMGGCDLVNGQKLLRHNQVLRNCLAFSNKARGFDQNSNKGSMNLYNCSAFGNGGSNFGITTTPLADGKTASVTNSVSYSGTVSLGSFVVQTTNSWQAPFVVTATDFVSVDPAAAYGPRNPDGSLPTITFMHLAAGSDLVNGGTNVGMPYLGSRPDLGCFESGCTSRIAADLNGNCQVEFADYAILASLWIGDVPNQLGLEQMAESWLMCNRDPADGCWQ